MFDIREEHMIKGIDSYSDVTSILPILKEQGYTFVVRYYSLAANSKRMSVKESTAIWQAGLKRVVVYQNKHNSYEKFSAEIAQRDASDAISQAKEKGHQSGIIYFAVDYDASESEIDGNITEHFRVLQKTLSPFSYGVGVYGSTLVCKKLKEKNIAVSTWVSNATGWGFGTSFDDWNIQQLPEKEIGGILVDENQAESVYKLGAW